MSEKRDVLPRANEKHECLCPECGEVLALGCNTGKYRLTCLKCLQYQTPLFTLDEWIYGWVIASNQLRAANEAQAQAERRVVELSNILLGRMLCEDCNHLEGKHNCCKRDTLVNDFWSACPEFEVNDEIKALLAQQAERTGE